jgi:hypothetical protein
LLKQGLALAQKMRIFVLPSCGGDCCLAMVAITSALHDTTFAIFNHSNILNLAMSASIKSLYFFGRLRLFTDNSQFLYLLRLLDQESRIVHSKSGKRAGREGQALIQKTLQKQLMGE